MTRGAAIAMVTLASVSSSCSVTDYFLRSANRETASIIEKEGAGVPNMESDFTIDPPSPASLVGLPRSSKTHDFLGAAADREIGATMISFAEALAIAVKHNRDYLGRKERLYEEALDLTLARHEFAPIFGAGGSADYSDGTAAVAGNLNNLVRTKTFTQRAGVGADKLLKTGARLSSDLTIDFLKFVNGNLRSVNSSSFAATLSQPLLRGAGSLAVTENLTQAERNLLYELRDFARFRKEFVVRIATRYYQVLQARDQVNNNWLAYQGFVFSVEREEALAEEDLSTQTELGQLKQASLRSELDWFNSLQSYLQRLDEFTIDLGLPIDSRIVLDERELAKLDIIGPRLTREEAAMIAVNTRLDLKNSRDRKRDRERRIGVFAQELLPGVDFVSSVRVGSISSSRAPGLESRLSTYTVGLDIDLDPDKKQERNAYRAALIAHQRAERDLEFDTDNIKLAINNDFRSLGQAHRQYKISEDGVDLALSRLEEQQLLMELGRGTARDLVDAQNDLVDSQNDRTAAVVRHTISRLNFWRDMGILFINKDGSWVRKLKEEES